jgi:hypothetical protein
MTSKERALSFLQTHLGQTVSMEMLAELSESFEDHRKDESHALRAVADLDEEVDDDSTE